MITWTTFLAFIAAVLSALLLARQQDDLLSLLDTSTIAQPTDRAGKHQYADLLHKFGGYGPYVQKVRSPTLNWTSMPDTCAVGQVHMVSYQLARHTERYPTFTAGRHMLDLHHKLRNERLNGSLAFVNDWKFFSADVKDFEQLTTTGPYAGTLTAFKLGVKIRSDYPQLLKNTTTNANRLKIWASDCQRVIDTAKYFSIGLLGLAWQQYIDVEVISESEDQGANTLTPGDTCTKYANDIDDYGWNYGSRMANRFKSTYLNTTKQRLSAQNPAVSLSEDELYVMQELCAFELMALGESQWCHVFTEAEWQGFAYTRDVLHYYRSGPGNPYAAAMGWLWLNATADLLRIGPRAGSLFLSFVHDGDIIPMLAALELFPQLTDLNVNHIDTHRTWTISDIVPMGARIIFERIACKKPQECWSNAPMYPNHVYCTPLEHDIYIRIIVNEAIIPLPGCTSGPDQTCPLEDFLTRIKQRGIKIGDFKTVCGVAKEAPDVLSFLHQDIP